MSKNNGSSVIIVSNRLPVQVDSHGKFTATTGGLASALSGISTPITWIGWPGTYSQPSDEKIQINIENSTIRYETVPLTQEQVDGFYNGFSNATLWPLLHYFPSLAQYSESWYQQYYNVNKIFTDVISQVVKPEDIVWVHDYQLMLLPGMLRERHPNLKIGYFLHVPFPSFEIFRCIPQRQELIEGLLGADLIGFHTFSYVRHFKSCVLRFIGLECSFDKLTYHGRTVRLGIHPIGINYKSFKMATETEEYKNSLEQYARDFANRKVVLSVSRLDYTKGIPDMLKSIAYFLEHMSDKKNDVTFVLIAVPSRESVGSYANLKETVVKTVGEINGRHSQISSPPPVQFIYYSVNTNKLAALYSIADVALVLPLIDGMNLVAKEYLCIQPDKYDPQSHTKPGTLILSEFTGASHELFNAQIINPYNHREVAETIERSLDLPYEERIQANLPMRERVRTQDSEYWASNFLRELASELPIKDIKCTPASVSSLYKPFLASAPGKKALFLDYDGTLTPIVSTPQAAVPSKKLLQILDSLCKRKDLDIAIISGRTKEFLESHFGRYCKNDLNITLVAEHGYQIKRAGSSWEMAKNIVMDWKEKILPYLEFYVETTPGSFVEEKKSSIVWHYRKSEPELGQKRATDLVGQLSEFVNNLPIEIHHGKKIVEVSSIEINKGQIVNDFLQNHEYTAALCAGDDSTDETMFRIQNKILSKIKVGDGDTQASYRWPTYHYTIEFLNCINK